MAKLVEGQLQVMQMVKAYAMPDRSISDRFMCDFVTTVATLQERFPDTIPRYVDIHPVMEEPRGKVLETTG